MLDWRDINENPDKSVAKYALNRVATDDGAGRGTQQYMQMTCVPHKLLGLKDTTDADLVSGVTSSPLKDYYFYVGAMDPNGTAGINVDMQVLLTYNCTMMNPKDLGASA